MIKKNANVPQIPPQDNGKRETAFKCKQFKRDPLVGGRIIWEAYRPERKNRGDGIHHKRMRHERFEEAKGKNDKIHHKRGGGRALGVAVSIVDKIFSAELRN